MTKIKNNIQTALKQKLILTNKMRSSLEILKMGAVDIKEIIKKELSENPFLQIDKSYKTKDYSIQKGNIKSTSDIIEETLENKAESILEHLLSQLRSENINKKDLDICEIIISYIDKDGYIKTPIEIIAKENNINIERAKTLLKLIKTLDPPGIASESLEEALITELKEIKSEYKNIAIEIIQKHLQELSQNKYDEIAKSLKIKKEDVVSAKELIATLEPYPGRDFSEYTKEYIIPEIYIYKENGVWNIRTNDSYIPRLQINKKYIKIKESVFSKSDLEYLEKEEEKAKNLIEAIEGREKTLYKTALALLHFQIDFFEHGREHIKPLRLSDIAENISLSKSTISRVVSRKYIQTEEGVFPLKYFFSSSVKNHSSRAVKEMIKRIIENSQIPLSDEKIRKILLAEGIDIARRTVGKYRKDIKYYSAK